MDTDKQTSLPTDTSNPLLHLSQDWRVYLGRNAFVLSTLLLVGLLVTLPILFLVMNSFNTAEFDEPAAYGLKSWFDAFSEPLVWHSLWNTLTLSVTRTIAVWAYRLEFCVAYRT